CRQIRSQAWILRRSGEACSFAFFPADAICKCPQFVSADACRLPATTTHCIWTAGCLLLNRPSFRIFLMSAKNPLCFFRYSHLDFASHIRYSFTVGVPQMMFLQFENQANQNVEKSIVESLSEGEKKRLTEMLGIKASLDAFRVLPVAPHQDVESRSGAAARECSVSRSRSSNRTGRFPASGFRTRVPALLHRVKPGFTFAQAVKRLLYLPRTH